jgi:hypothetical protein
MKRIMYLGLILLIGAGSLAAQQWGYGPGCGMGWGPGQGKSGPKGPGQGSQQGWGPQSGPSRGNYRNANPETISLTGKLELIDGQIALQKDETTYYVLGLRKLIGFVDGLKEGAEVTLEGVALGSPRNEKNQNLLISKLVLNGKEYDNLNPALAGPRGNRAGSNPPPQPGMRWNR